MVRPPQRTAEVQLSAGQEVELVLTHRVEADAIGTTFSLGLETPALPEEDELAHAVELAASADVAVLVLGTSDESESEGFDRDTLALPGRQDELVRLIERERASGVFLSVLGVGTKPDGTTGIYMTGRGPNQPFHAAITVLEHGPAGPAISRPLLANESRRPDVSASFVEDLGGCCAGCPAQPPSAFGLYSPDLGDTWSDFQIKPPMPPTTCDYRGRGPAIASLANLDLVVVAADVDVREQGAPDPDWLNNEGRPFVTWSDDQGESWTQDPIRIGEGSGIVPPQPGDAIAIDGGEFLPHIASAYKPSTGENFVFVIFAGQESPEAPATDMYLARSFDGAFLCWILEHAPQREALLAYLADHQNLVGLSAVTVLSGSAREIAHVKDPVLGDLPLRDVSEVQVKQGLAGQETTSVRELPSGDLI